MGIHDFIGIPDKPETFCYHHGNQAKERHPWQAFSPLKDNPYQAKSLSSFHSGMSKYSFRACRSGIRKKPSPSPAQFSNLTFKLYQWRQTPVQECMLQPALCRVSRELVSAPSSVSLLVQ
ncbi:hypothetical protein V6N13_092041 [Hibiscus sabdariffa]